MLKVQEAEKLILECVPPSSSQSLNLEDLREEVLAEKLVADRNYPSFHRVAMDGIAVALSDDEPIVFAGSSFSVEGVQRAGIAPLELKGASNCIEVMTGSVLPVGCDAVIRYEDVEIDNGVARVTEDLEIKKFHNVHQEGVDYQAGDTLARSGTLLSSPVWSIAASIGKSSVLVNRRPRIAVISTGDELVPPGVRPEYFQVRQSNSYTLLSSLRAHGFFDVKTVHIRDEKSEIYSALQRILHDSDVIVMSGGVSMGKYDLIPNVLADLKVKKVFHKVAQRPGKPLWFGVSSSDRLVFGLPGNPVSSLICFHRYVLPALWKFIGAPLSVMEPRAAVLSKEVRFNKNLTYFLPVSIRNDGSGRLRARPVASNGSGDFASLVNSTGFLELDADQEVFKSGSFQRFRAWRCH